MIKIENTKIVGLEPAIRGMRNPMNSWDKSDSKYCDERQCLDCPGYSSGKCNVDYFADDYIIGPNDLDLMKRLAAGGPVHAKYRRMLIVYADVTAPLYWWKEYDTYKVGTVANSCSTMHKIHSKEFTMDDFSYEHLLGLDDLGGTTENIKVYDPDTNSFENDKIDYGLNILKDGSFMPWAIMGDGSYALSPKGVLTEAIIPALNRCRELYLETKDKKYWWQMIQLLPSSYNQKRTIMLSYEVLHNIYIWRKDHKLDEWHKFCEWVESLPYAKEIILCQN